MDSTLSESIGAAARVERAAAFDSWLAMLLSRSVGGERDTPSNLSSKFMINGVALVAVGGLGRREVSPFGDLDLILLHSGQPEVGTDIWYAIWDKGIRLDHSTRTVAESLDAAYDDVKVALGLLDVRHIAGDSALTSQLAREAAELWRRTARSQLGRLHQLCQQRHHVHGDLAYLLEGDIKEASGGLRDVTVLRGIGMAGVADVPPAVRAAASRLLDCRDALHLAAGRRVDRLRAQDRDQVAHLLGMQDGEALLRRIGLDARMISWTLDDSWRSVRHGKSPRRPVARDVVAANGEVLLARSVVTPQPDPSLALRVAAAAAQARLPIARATLEWLARFTGPVTQPWPADARAAFLTLLGSGPGLLSTWEACDRFDLVSRWLPQWTRLRGAPQHHPVHQYTLDRHLVQAAANAAQWSREVSRPDLLVLGALLHDVGKGLPGDHSVVGAPIAASVASMIGLPQSDVDIIAKVVLHHLLLPDIATKRDLDDPVVISHVASLVGDVATLEILHMLARADAQATGPAAWSDWKSRLLDMLVGRVRRLLADGVHPLPAPPDPTLVAGALPVVQVASDWVRLAAVDRPGLLAAVAGCLATHRLEIVAVNSSSIPAVPGAASAVPGELSAVPGELSAVPGELSAVPGEADGGVGGGEGVRGRALVECAVSARYGDVDMAHLAADLRRVALDRFVPPPRLGVGGASGIPPKVLFDGDLLEVRATDAPGLLYRITSALAALGVDVRAARISTLGADVVDVFYLGGSYDRDEVEAAVLAAAS